ncbi:MAG: hypothetical protein JWO33_340 [Caulobacteraceae bacterium]|nr:hypothetical protein [Caulobacteraceae bacterium]
MNKRFWVTASIAGALLVTPLALAMFNPFGLGWRMSGDAIWGMVLLGLAVAGLAAIIQAPMTVTDVVREVRRNARS